MLKQSVLLISTLLLAGPALEARQPAQAQQQQRPAAPQSVDDRTSGMKKLDGYFPLYWDERTGIDVPRDPAVRYRLPVLERACRRASARTTSASIAVGRRRRPHRAVPARRPARACWCRATSRSDRAARTRSSASRSRIRSRSRSCGASRSRPSRTAACSSTPPTSSCAMSRTPRTRLRPGNYRVDRTRSAFYLPNTTQLPEEHRSRHDADLRQRADRRWRRRWRRSDPGPRADWTDGRRRWGRRIRRRPVLGLGRQRHAVPRSGDAARARVVRRAARRQLPAARTTIRAPATAASRFVDYSRRSASRSSSATSAVIACRRRIRAAAMSEPVKPIQYWVDSGAPEDVKKALIEGAMLVEPGVRSRRLPQRVQGRRAARRRRPDGHPLQHDQLGPPLDARLELGRLGVGSAHRRDHQGHGHARLAARSPGLHDLRGPAVAVHQRQRAAGGALRDRARSASASCRRTKSATRSASATTTTTAARAGSR